MTNGPEGEGTLRGRRYWWCRPAGGIRMYGYPSLALRAFIGTLRLLTQARSASEGSL